MKEIKENSKNCTIVVNICDFQRSSETDSISFRVRAESTITLELVMPGS
jgi:hypothetical protein